MSCAMSQSSGTCYYYFSPIDEVEMEFTVRLTVFVLFAASIAIPFAHSQSPSTKPKSGASRVASKPAMTNADVVKMSKAGLTEDTIISAMQHSKTHFDVTPDALISLLKNGVGKTVIQSMAAASSIPPMQAGATSNPAQNLADDFAKSSLRALNGIKVESGHYSMEGGSISVPRATNQLISDADAQGNSVESDVVISLLKKLYMLRLYINMEREIYTMNSYEPVSAKRENDKADADPEIIANTSKFLSCSSELDTALRYRKLVEVPKACDNLEKFADSKTKQ
jgi:hypothetical protein